MSQAKSLPKIQLHNTLSGKKEIFEPLKEGHVSFYGCGPTVYGLTHVGNARTSVTLDLLVRIFKHAGYQTHVATNITDIDDRIIKVALDSGRDTLSVAEGFTRGYLEELRLLMNLPVDNRPRATESLDEIRTMIAGLIEKGLAYAAETPFGKDVYFSVSKFKGYGKLSKRHIEDMRTGIRIEPGESKHDALDFALWKAAKPKEPSWESPWGPGRPGWHIECSAMIERIFHGPIDIHHGGVDLVFPHHENEIAQSEGLSGKHLAAYWVHNGMLNFGREKMSKSIGNIFTTQKFLEQYGPEAFRLLILQHHYKGPMDFSMESILRAEHLLERLYECKRRALDVSKDQTAERADEKMAVDLPDELKNLKHEMSEALFDDFNSAKALGLALKAARTCYREDKSAYWHGWGESLALFSEVFALLGQDPTVALAELRSRKLKRLGLSEERVCEIERRLEERENARKNRDFSKSDEIRKGLERDGILVMDGPDGVHWSIRESTTESAS